MTSELERRAADERAAHTRKGGVARIALLLLTGALLSGVWLTMRARAQLGERGIALGHGAADALRNYPGTTPLTLNGQRLSLNATSTKLTVDAVLDRFTAVCGRSDGGMQAYLEGLRTTSPKLAAESTWSRLTLFRNRGEKAGTAACIARDASDAPFADLVARISESLEHADLARLGQFRYVFARASPSGLTQVISVWSRGPLKLAELVAEDGHDAAGSDLVFGARPESSVRVVSARADANGFEASLYESAKEPAQALGSYDSALRARGYAPVAAPQLDAVAPVPVRAYTLAGRDPLLAVAIPAAHGSLVSTFRIGANGSL